MIDLILSTGSNLGDRMSYLKRAKELLSKKYDLIEESKIYESSAVDYLNQPDFLNQVLHFKTSKTDPYFILMEIGEIENDLGRLREIDKGPRTLDIDILFFDKLRISGPKLEIPHPRQFERSFIVQPLKELKIAADIEREFPLPLKFDNSCWVYSETNS